MFTKLMICLGKDWSESSEHHLNFKKICVCHKKYKHRLIILGHINYLIICFPTYNKSVADAFEISM